MDLDSDGIQSELLAHLLDGGPRVGPGPVQLVDERQPRHVVPLHLP